VKAQPLLRAITPKVLVGHRPGAGEQPRMAFERQEEVPRTKSDVTAKRIRRHTHDEVRNAIQSQRLANDVGIGAQAVLPEPVGEDDDGFCGQRVVC
jgi:hypothetical protein